MVGSRTSSPNNRPLGPAVLVGTGASAGSAWRRSGRPGRLFVSARGRTSRSGWLAGHHPVDHTSRGRGRLSQEEFLASLAGCGVRSAWSLCAVGKIGELRVAGQGVDVPLTASGLMIKRACG